MQPISFPARSCLLVAKRILVGGQVQGVGYRPFVHRLAIRLEIRGWVRNLSGEVLIEAEGSSGALSRFVHELVSSAPTLARPRLVAVEEASPAGHGRFQIIASSETATQEVHLPSDQSCCDDCVRELWDPANRRYRHPFINCTQCGPRYTLIRRLPYDRINTSMAGFPLCDACRAEYEDPLDRRFHAEPVACAACGPQLRFENELSAIDGEAALTACVDALRAGHVVAVKGVGGYHLMCDAMNQTAVSALRARKGRPHKPLAVMFPWRGTDGLGCVREQVLPDCAAEAALVGPVRPIVLCRRRHDASLPTQLAPGLDEIGAMLPYSPLHHLLLDDFGGPLVATSANLSGEPVLSEGGEVVRRLGHVADAFLHHDRPILRPADDAVVRVIAGRARPLRLGRGVAPVERELPFEISMPTLAVGGHLKSSVALAWGRRVVISPHIGDLDSPRGMEVFSQVIADLQHLYGVQAQRVLCDAHPDYASHRWARASGLPLTVVPHHHAHASALAGEYADVGRWLVFTWDGAGLGEDGTLWGGEALLGQMGTWQRVASFRPFILPGGERAGREPWRSAAALCWEMGLEWDHDEVALLQEAWRRRINAPETSAVGRLFDAAAAILGLVERASFEGQGPMWLEAIAAGHGAAIKLPLARDGAGVWRSDWEPLVRYLMQPGRAIEQRAMDFHHSLARALADQVAIVAREHHFDGVGLTGGVFQNRRLSELVVGMLESAGYGVCLPEALPCNDAALAFGQIIHVGSPI